MLVTYILYTIIFVLAASFAYAAQYGSDASQRMWGRIFCFMCLFVPAALRYGIGADYFSYYGIYNNNFPDDMQRLELGFVFIGRLCRMAGLSPVMFMAVIAGITYGLICFYAPRKHIFTIITFYILSFLYLNSYSMSRQSMATSILLCGFSLFYNNRKVKGFLLFVVASLIHYSSLVAVPIILISHLKINNCLRFCFMAVFIFIFINEDILVWLISIGTSINARNAYLIMSLSKTEIVSGMTFIIMAVPSMLILLNSKKISGLDNGNFILNANIIYIAVVIATFIIAIFGRILQMLFFIPLLSIQILYIANKRYANLYHSLLVVLFFALFVRKIGTESIYRKNIDGGGYAISPYNSIFNKGW